MQGMNCKYDGHAWCKVKTSNIKIVWVWDLKTLGAWGTCIEIMIPASISSTLLFETK
jgi:hypothetical protein